MYNGNYSEENILNEYYANNAFKLRHMVDQIMHRKHGGIKDKDMDEFYSVANEVFTDIIIKKRHDKPKDDFTGFLYKSLDLAIIDEFKRQNRDKRRFKIEVDIDGEKRKIPIKDVYIDAPLKEDGTMTIGDTLQSDFDMDNVLSERMNDYYFDEGLSKYLKKLSNTQRKIIEMKMADVPVSQIKKALNLTDKQYKHNCDRAKSFENTRELYISTQADFKEDSKEMKETHTTENCKTDKLNISSIIKKMDNHTILFNHPLQRESEQWTLIMKGNLISDILQGNKLNPLIFAEQIIDEVPVIWDLDGKQHCTNVYLFSKNKYKISKNIRRYLIKYQSFKKDENGDYILSENGVPVAVNEECDIRGKRFSDLPEELQERFWDYSFNYDKYLNCSDEDIGYHIERYNDGKPMTISQKGLTKLGTEFAETVKSISAMPFFKDMGGYKVSEFKNGAINRMVVESVMSVNYFDNWGKFDDMCRFINKNAHMTAFENFEDIVTRLEKIVTGKTADMFNSKNSFLWFAMFAKCIELEFADKRFIEFMDKFDESLHSVPFPEK